MRRILLGSTLFLAACPPPSSGFDGVRVYQYFQYQKLRTWTFESDDPTVPYQLIAQQRRETEKEAGTDIQIYAIDFTPNCFNNSGVCEPDTVPGGTRDFEETVLDTWKLSTELIKGVRFHEASGVVFDPAVKLADGEMQLPSSTDPITSGGITYTATYAAREKCPVTTIWPDEATRPACLRLELDDGGADSVIAGTYWVVSQYGIVAFSRDIDDGALWSVQKYEDVDL